MVFRSHTAHHTYVDHLSGRNANFGANLSDNARPGEILVDESTLKELAAWSPEAQKRPMLQHKGAKPHSVVWVLRSLNRLNAQSSRFSEVHEKKSIFDVGLLISHGGFG